MTPAALIDAVSRLGVVLSVEGADLVHRGPRGAMGPDLIAALRAHKLEIVAELSCVKAPAAPCPVDIHETAARLEFEEGLRRDDAEHQALAERGLPSWPALADALRARIEAELVRLPPRCTRDGRRLLQVTRDFLASHWFNRAIALGWDTVELFGINADAERPLIGNWGFLVTVALVASPGSKIVNVSDVGACYRTKSGKLVAWPRFRPSMADNVLWWECSAIVNADN